ncbi:MAG: hypothetical protein ACLR56_02985 [Oscillospiraceae bacterium]
MDRALFTFYATSYYVSVQTPGNVSSISTMLRRASFDAKSSDCSQSIKIDEYVPAFAENSTSLLNGNIDKNLVKETAAAGAAFPAGAAVAIACAAAVIALGGVITVFVVIRRRRAKSNEKSLRTFNVSVFDCTDRLRQNTAKQS